ncbi:unnamed protein product, partial [Rotaria sp. Silwood2]
SLTRLIHNGNAPTVELLNSLDLLQQTWLATSDPSLPSELKIFDQMINASLRYAIPSRVSYRNQNTVRLHTKVHLGSLAPDVKSFVIKYTAQRTYNLFKTTFYEQQRFSSDRVDIFHRTHDGCLMYKKNNLPAIGFLETIISFGNDHEPVLIIRPVSLISTADSMSIHGRIYRCTNVLYGTYHRTTIEITNLQSIVQKLAFRPGTDVKFPSVHKSMFFFQYPNRSGST